ncbi:cytochrome P450 [Sanghuangporus baumii]|uniref:Cytochrome P450 n=1 Tax=Sanghuangporus baumii TaxID=108892 RepID=A0A9Q5I471_SANBA|nr:cytochrome P450 [Sanghuangporus baumii]
MTLSGNINVFTLVDLTKPILDFRSHRYTPVFAVTATGVIAWVWFRLLQRVRVKSLVRGLPGPDNPSWLTGNFPEIYDVLNVRWHHEAVRRYGKLFQINGMFGDEQLYITDPRAMHQVLVKEHSIFEEPQSLLVMNRALMGDGLLATLGEHHKKQRKVLNPVFSVKHMRGLLPIFWPITQKLIGVFEAKIARSETNGITEINVYEWAGRTSLEFIAQGGVGTSLDQLVDGVDSEYSKLVKEMVPTISRLHVPMQLLPIVYPFFHLLPIKLRSLMLRYSPLPASSWKVRKLVQITDRLEDTSRTVLKNRRTAVLAELTGRPTEKTDDVTVHHEPSRDVLSVLLRAQYLASEADHLPESEIISQITTLLFAAQDTTSSALSRTLQVLAMHPEAQVHLRQEVRHAKEAADSDESAFGDYDSLMRLPFLDAVVRETLRLYPPVSWGWRVARAVTTLPLYRPIELTKGPRKGELITSIPVAKNQQVVTGIAAAQRDENVWGEDADVWRPERWLDGRVYEDNPAEDGDEFKTDLRPVSALVDKDARYPGVYSGMMTFSGGARSCIGFKFALLALKLQLAALVDRFQFALPDEEIVWNMNHIAAPTVRGRESEGAQMPLRVSIAA